ncbi:MAG TPA: hypothetical protein VGB46_07440, partial [Flavisolibacter sp.]
RIHALAYRLFGKSSIDECGLQDIRTLAERYPYFAPAQFLLLEKLKRTGSEDYQVQSQKAVLYYHNPIEFEQFISSDRFYTELDLEDPFLQPSPPETIESSPEIPGEEIAEEETAVEEDAVEETIQATEPEVMSEDMAIAEDILHPEAAEPEPEEAPSMKAAPVEEDTIEEETETGTEIETEEATEETIPMATEPEVMSEDMAIAEDIIHPEAAEPEPEEASSMKAVPVEDEQPSPDESPVAESQTVESPLTETPSTPLPSASTPSTETPSASIPSTLTPSSEGLTFEPFHTVDYFASQGIKLSQEEVGSGKFGKQLKSFTEWLRTMKRLPPPELSARLDRSTEKTVQSLAEGSVSDTDIVTEAMAEVWIKQGKPEKALEVYNKLSLLNPSKKAYFAAKIDNLKR